MVGIGSPGKKLQNPVLGVADRKHSRYDQIQASFPQCPVGEKMSTYRRRLYNAFIVSMINTIFYGPTNKLPDVCRSYQGALFNKFFA
jgi:hypothetical protein